MPETQSAMGNMITYMPMALSSLGMVLIFLRPGSGGGPMMYVAIGLMALSAVGMLVSQIVRASGDRKRALLGERRDYMRYLSISRRRIRKVINQQREAQAWSHPDPASLWSLVPTARLWERRAAHADYAEVRIAVGEQQLATKLSPLSTKPVEDLEPLSAHALRRFIKAYGTVPDQPVALYLRTYARVLLRSADEEAARAMVRAVLAQLSVFHAPQDLWIVVLADHDRREAWEWVKWLPHNQHPTDVDGGGPVRLVTDSVLGLETLLGDELTGRPAFETDAVPSAEEPYCLVVLDSVRTPTDSRLATDGYRNTVTLDVSGSLPWRPSRHTLRLRITERRLELVGTDRSGKETTSVLGRPDALGPRRAKALATLMTPYRMGGTTDNGEALTTDVQLTSLLGLPDLHTVDLDAVRAERSERARLRVPLGLAGDGTPVELDIKEAAQGGMGPHGVLIGATGSGKSELLRTLVLALALTHSSEKLNFVLVDFKGGATFLGLEDLPHTSAVITNLADESSLVDRMQDALHGELMRRQELLRGAGNYTSAYEYETARAAGADLEPLPTLFVVVDEFSELLSAHRDFMDLFVMVGRLGRSLGVHLLLASQRLDEGRMTQLESHLSYRIALRTFSSMESRGVLGVPDAYQLPSVPGSAILKKDTGTLVRFKAAYVSGPYQGVRRVGPSAVAGQVVPYRTEWTAPRLPAPDPEPQPAAEEASEETLLALAVTRMREGGRPAHQVWLPPLDRPLPLDVLLMGVAPHAERGLTTLDPGLHGTLTVPVGVIDRPFDQTREPLIAELSGAGGHVGIAGGPQSGKSTLVRDLIMSLALTHTPREVQFYCLDFGGGSLGALRDLPHVGGVTGRLDLERVQRTLAEVQSLVARREKQFAELGIDSMATLRARRTAGELADEPYGDVFLVVDGWGTIRQDFMDLMDTFTALAARGLNYGVHLILAASRWSEIPTALRDQLGTRFELRLGDSMDSMINMRSAATIPKSPGRGMTETKHHFLTALPRLDGGESAADLAAGVTDAVARVTAHWQGPPAPAVRTLPSVLDPAELPDAEVGPDGDLRLPLGLEGNHLDVLWHDFAQTAHLVVVGDAETGKTNLLRSVCRAITDRYTPAEARILLIDYRRGLLESVPESHRLGYAVSVDLLKQAVDGVARAMKERLPGADISPARLKRRDWWSGPRVFLVVDDYDMVSSGTMSNHFGPLLDYLAQGAEIGLHLIVARSANGASRAMNDSLLRWLIEVNTPAALLSCPPSEGYLFNDTKPKQLPCGRAQLITRRGVVQVQTPLLSEPAGDA